MRNSATMTFDATGLIETVWAACVRTRAVPTYPSMVFVLLTGTRSAP